MGRIHLDAGRWAQAVGALAQAVQVLSVAAEAGGESEALTRARLDMADALVDGGQVEDARSLYDAARRDAEGSGADWLARRAVEGGVRCDLRTGTPDDIRLAVDRLQEDDTDPWLLAEAAAALGDAEAALRWAEASVSQDLDVPAADLPVRYALLAGLLVGAGRPLDAFAAYRAGTVAQLRDRLGPALLPRDPALDGLDAQLKAARALLDQDLTPSVRAFWAGRRRALAQERAAWSRDLALKDPALASLLVVEAAAAQAPATTADAPLAALLAGEEDTLAFVAAGDVRTVRLPPLTDARAARRFWPTLRAAAPAARRWRLSPPPEHSGFSWHTLPGAPSADRLTFTPPAAPLARPGGTGAAIPAPPDPLDPLTFDPATLLAASLQGRTVRVRAPADPAAGPALDIAIRLCLYAGADEVRVVLPSGREARWVR